MTTLSSAPLLPVLDRLFADSRKRRLRNALYMSALTILSGRPFSSLIGRFFSWKEASPLKQRSTSKQISAEERVALLKTKTNYREFYGFAKNAYLAISRETGVLLYMLVRSTGARAIVEFGTSFGISSLHLAAALRDNGGGHLITTEFEPSKVVRARENFIAGGLSDLIEIREGDALETLGRDLPDHIDLVLLDGAKDLYPPILKLLEDRLRPGAFIVADNADMSPEYLKHVRSPTNGYMSVSFDGDVELSMRTG